ncbi:nitrate reductase [Photobacterium gaetbulicola]|uniref:Nitrate reductase large subunit n=1 Tax=Photobacterium gaetbulicola Gung47 TaxID=658445 RepID=A0A0C5WSM9_9GAMM|nr:nitrate reductase [Photobacterium gaetbulicola]AJR09397.1 nitrate reductase large subunit [Photobacterium gaetbulicola Gung47]PSU14200.1 nitrate reductase [Photobacterium gaetbulicola]
MGHRESNKWIKSTCPYCGVGCGIEATANHHGGLEVRGDSQHPANFGRLCSKGLALGETVGIEGRLLTPQINQQDVTWEEALTDVATHFRQIIEHHGNDAVAFYVSGQLLTEDYYVANKLMKGFIGSGNIDTNSRLCMSSSVAGHKRAFGADIVPGCYEDLEQADLIVLTGSNLAWCHPVLFQRIRDAKAHNQCKVIVIDPRRTPSCDIADLHLPLLPGSDIALFNGLLAFLSENRAMDFAYIDQDTEGLDLALATAFRFGDIESVQAATGLDREQILAFYQLFAATEKTVTVYSQGINQSTSGTNKVNSILNCHLATGRIGKPGSTPFSITGQPNAMGGREVGGLANMLAAHMDFGNPEHTRQISEFWQTDNLARTPGLKALDMFNAIESGKIKAIWIMATNPAVSLPDNQRLSAALANCPYVVVSDCMADTDTLRHADVALPAQGWGEKSGTVTNSERRISRQRRLLPSPGEAKPDWWIISEVAKKMGFGYAFNYQSEADIFREYAQMTTLGQETLTPSSSGSRTGNHGQDVQALSRPLNLSGLADLTPKQYHQLAPQQWPVTQYDQPTARLFGNGEFATPSGKAQFIATDHRPTAEQTSSRYPLRLNTGRIRDHWHTMTRTGLSPRLSEHTSEPYLALSAQDAERFSIEQNKLVKVSSERGCILLRARISKECLPGQVFAPFHWNDCTTSMGKVNALLAGHRDPLSGQPELKATPVCIHPSPYQSEALLISQTNHIPDWLSPQEHWTCQRNHTGYLFRITSQRQPGQLHRYLATHLAKQQGRGQQVVDIAARTQSRYAQFQNSQLQGAFIVSDDLHAGDNDYLYTLIGRSISDPLVQALFTGKAMPEQQAGRLVCACKQVGANTIAQAIRAKSCGSVRAISEATQAGTGCGSCVSELQMMLDDIQIKQA